MAEVGREDTTRQDKRGSGEREETTDRERGWGDETFFSCLDCLTSPSLPPSLQPDDCIYTCVCEWEGIEAKGMKVGGSPRSMGRETPEQDRKTDRHGRK